MSATQDISISTVYICELCGGKLHVRPKINAGTTTEHDVTFYNTVRVDLCERCQSDYYGLVRDLYNALPWEKREQFDHPILETLETRIYNEQVDAARRAAA